MVLSIVELSAKKRKLFEATSSSKRDLCRLLDHKLTQQSFLHGIQHPKLASFSIGLRNGRKFMTLGTDCVYLKIESKWFDPEESVK